MCTSEHNLNMFQPETMWEIVFRVLNCIALGHSKPSRRASLMVVAFLPWVQSVVQRAPAKRSLPARLLKWYDGNHIPRDQSKFIFFSDMMTSSLRNAMCVQPKSSHNKSTTNEPDWVEGWLPAFAWTSLFVGGCSAKEAQRPKATSKLWSLSTCSQGSEVKGYQNPNRS